VRLVFTSSRVTELPPDGRQDLLEALSRNSEVADWPVIREWLDPVTGGDDDRVLRVLAPVARRMLWLAEPQDRIVGECLNLAARHGRQDALLADLMKPAGELGPGAGGLDLAVRLLNDLVFEGSADGIRAHPLTREVITGDVVLACEYLAGFARSGRDARRCLRWLEQTSPLSVLSFFAIALGASSGQVSRDDIDRLAASSFDFVRALLETASSARRLDRVLPGFLPWLAGAADTHTGGQPYWEPRLKGLVTGDSTCQALLDVALLTTGAPPGGLPPTGRDGNTYIQAFAKAWAVLRRDCPTFDSDRAATVLTRYLEGKPWASDKAQAEAVVGLATQLLRSQPQSGLAGAVATALEGSADAARWPFARNWVKAVRKNSPDGIRDGILAALRDMAPGTSPGQVAGTCRRAYLEQIAPEIALAELAESGASRSPELAMAALRELRQQFEETNVEPDDTWAWLTCFVSKMAARTSSEPGRPAFRDLLSREARYDIWLQLDLLTSAAKRAADGRPLLTDAEREDLARISASAEAILKAAKPRRHVPSLWRTVETGGTKQPVQEA
jgi:hypothetical protein